MWASVVLIIVPVATIFAVAVASSFFFGGRAGYRCVREQGGKMGNTARSMQHVVCGRGEGGGQRTVRRRKGDWGETQIPRLVST
jgi:hypothetical protein